MYRAAYKPGRLMATIQMVCAYRTVYIIIFMPIGNYNLTSLPAEFGTRMLRPNTYRSTLMEGSGMIKVCKLYRYWLPESRQTVHQTPGAPAYRFVVISVNVCFAHSYPWEHDKHDNRHFTWSTTICMIVHEIYTSIISTPTWHSSFSHFHF